MNKEDLLKYVDEYFEKNMCVSFNKFLENWKETTETNEFLKKENQQLKEKIKQKDEGIKKVINRMQKWCEWLGCLDMSSKTLRGNKNDS